MLRSTINLSTGRMELVGDDAIAQSYSDTSVLFWNDTTKRIDEDATYFVYTKSTHSLGIGGTPASDTRFHIKGTTTSHVGRFDIGVDFNQVASPPTLPTLTVLAVAGNINNGVHFYRYTFKTAVGETQLNNGTGFSSFAVTTSAGNQQVLHSNLPISTDYRVTHLCIYRAVTGNIYYNDIKKVGEVANGVTTFTDNISDANRTGIDSFARLNTTNRFITVNGSPALMLATTDTYTGYRAGEGAVLGTSSGGENSLYGAQVGVSTPGSKNAAFGAFIVVGSSDSSVLMGHGAGGIGAFFQNSIIAGRNTAFWNSVCYNSIYLGGGKGTTYYQANNVSSVGMEALALIATGAGNLSILGAFAARNLTTSVGTAIIGAYVNPVSATENGQGNYQNVLYVRGGYSLSVNSSTPTATGCLGVAVNPSGNARLELAAGSTTIAPFKLISSGAGITGLKTTAAKGDIEFSDYGFWATPGTVRHKIWEGLIGAAAPATNAIGVIADYFGTSATRVLTTPDTWATITGDDGAPYKVPAYL